LPLAAKQSLRCSHASGSGAPATAGILGDRRARGLGPATRRAPCDAVQVAGESRRGLTPTALSSRLRNGVRGLRAGLFLPLGTHTAFKLVRCESRTALADQHSGSRTVDIRRSVAHLARDGASSTLAGTFPVRIWFWHDALSVVRRTLIRCTRSQESTKSENDYSRPFSN
jgi:hypothetical protein